MATNTHPVTNDEGSSGCEDIQDTNTHPTTNDEESSNCEDTQAANTHPITNDEEPPDYEDIEATNSPPTTNKEPNKTSHSNDRLLRWVDVQPLVGICRSHAHQLVAEGKFPAPIKLVEGGRASAWLESEIREWIEQRVEASRAADPKATEGEA